MTISKNGLKPCPFCGKSVVVWETAYGVVKVVECKTCSIRFVFPWSKTETGKDLADIWNRRRLEKQTPLAPDYEADGYADGKLVYDMAYCPVCGHEFEYGISGWGSAYCPDCGQVLDWSADQEE